MSETLTAPSRKKLTVTRRAEADRQNQAGAGTNRSDTTSKTSLDGNSIGHMRSYMRLLHSFLESTDDFGILTGNPVTKTSAVRDRLICIERKLVSEARAAYINERKRKRVVVPNTPDSRHDELSAIEFDRLPYLDQIKCVNRIYFERIDAIESGNQTYEKTSEDLFTFADPDLDNSAAQNRLAMIRIQTPGFSLSNYTLRSQLPDGQWIVSPIPDDGSIDKLAPSEVIELCENFVFRKARRLYLSSNIVDGKINGQPAATKSLGERIWRKLPYKEQQFWIGKMLDSLLQESQAHEERALQAHGADSGAAVIGVNQKIDESDLDLQNKIQLRTYLRLLHSFLENGDAADKSPRSSSNPKKIAGLSALVHVLENMRRGSHRHLNTRLNDVEKELTAEARKSYIQNHKLFPLIGISKNLEIGSIGAEFDRMTYLERAAYINEVNKDRIAKKGCDAGIHASYPLIAPEVENLVVENILSILRMPTPGLSLLNHQLKSKNAFGVWLASYKSDKESSVILYPMNVFKHCDSFVRSLAGNLFASCGENDGRIPGDDSGEVRALTDPEQMQWRRLTYPEQHEWMKKALDILSREAQEEALALAAQAAPFRLPSVRPRA